MGTHTNTFSYIHEKTQTNHTLTKTKMEAERRSTMSSLKGQSSNVEGSVKSMKVAVVVGSVLKVSYGTLTSKSGQAVLTTNTQISQAFDLGSKTLFTETTAVKINAVVINGESTTVICDDLVAVQENGETKFSVTEGSVLASVVVDETVEKRNLNCPPCLWFAVQILRGVATELIIRIYKDSCRRGSLSGIAAKACKIVNE